MRRLAVLAEGRNRGILHTGVIVGSGWAGAPSFRARGFVSQEPMFSTACRSTTFAAPRSMLYETAGGGATGTGKKVVEVFTRQPR